MKNILLFTSIMFILTSCATSKKGAWTEADKKKARAEIAKVEGEIRESLGDNTEKFIECCLVKVMETYENFKEANADYEGCEAIATKCAFDAMY